jgi:hypothetical protein
MARIVVTPYASLDFDLDSQEGRRLASAFLLAIPGREEEARLLLEGVANTRVGQVVHKLASGWWVRINVQVSMKSEYRRALVNVTQPGGHIEYEDVASEISGDGCDAATLWLSLCAVSSPGIRMPLSVYLRWLCLLRLKPVRNAEVTRRKAAARRLLEELAGEAESVGN